MYFPAAVNSQKQFVTVIVGNSLLPVVTAVKF